MQTNFGLFHFHRVSFSVTLKAKSREYPRQDYSFTYYTQYWWSACHFKNTYSPITLGNISSINLVSIFRCSSSPNHPVYVRCVDFSDLVLSLSSSRHSCIGLVFNSHFLDSLNKAYLLSVEISIHTAKSTGDLFFATSGVQLPQSMDFSTSTVWRSLHTWHILTHHTRKHVVY